MRIKTTFGLKNLTKNVITIIYTSISTLLGSQSKAVPLTPRIPTFDPTRETTKASKIKSKLILKLNTKNIESSLLVNHTSHASHSSHSSHSSYSPPPGHYSHSSHVSSSPSYSPIQRLKNPKSTSPAKHLIPTVTDNYPINVNKRAKINMNKKITLLDSSLGQRVLFKDCFGKDVRELQYKLMRLGYFINFEEIMNDYFGTTTEASVMNFQEKHGLEVDGKVGQITLKHLNITINENSKKRK